MHTHTHAQSHHPSLPSHSPIPALNNHQRCCQWNCFFFKVKLQVQLPVPSSTVTVHFQKCKICRKKGDDDRLLLCDDCNQAFHMYCLRPQLIHVPRGDWFCAACVVSDFIPAHLSLSCLFCCICVLRFGTLYYTWIEMEAQAG